MKDKELHNLLVCMDNNLLAGMDRTITSLKAGVNALDAICEGMTSGQPLSAACDLRRVLGS